MRLVRVSPAPRAAHGQRFEPRLTAESQSHAQALSDDDALRLCPDCALDLEWIRVAESRAQYCPACQGMWLQRESAVHLVGRPAFARWHPASDPRAAQPRQPGHAFQLRLVHGSGGVD
jgi:Zn-finger nucleic acid-binding protein